MKVNDVQFGFRVTRAREIQELGGTLWELEHIATGAKLAWMDNGQSNKLFSIGFKTLPWNDTGVFHILEHSVLNGSKKYPVKEPFVNLLKSSMNTFLNAMTFPDKTIFPVSSRNEQDFLNLTSVYLDAVFCPAIYENPNIFYQEGWHYELSEENARPVYNGVVFNEMKGALSSPDTLLMDGIMRLLFPDSCYGYVSGGDPAHIPELSYAQFLDAHREFYHPGNSFTYLDGDVPLEKVLELLDGYFADRQAPAKVHEIPVQPQRPYTQTTAYYEAGENADAMLITGQLLGSWQDRKTLLALSALCSYLCGSNESPLKKAILSSGIAKEASLFTEDSIVQPFIALQVKQMDADRKEELMELVRKLLASHVIDKKALEATIDHMEFSLRDIQEPSGLIRNILSLNTWLPGGDLLEGMHFTPLFAALRQMLAEGGFEKLLRSITFSGSNAATMLLLPSADKGEEDRLAEAKRLEMAAASWTLEDRQQLLELNRKLSQWQCTPDTEEAIAKLPALPLDQISREPEYFEAKQLEVAGRSVLLYQTAAAGISHFRLLFRVADLSVEQLQKLSLLADVLGELPTQQCTVAELEQLRRSTLGRLSFSMTVFPEPKDPQRCSPCFAVSFSVLTHKEAQGLDLVRQILCDTKFTGEESQKILKILLAQGKESLFQSILASGNRYASQRAASHWFAASWLQEKLEGYDFYSWICNLNSAFDTAAAELQADLEALTHIFCSSRLTACVAAEKESAHLQSFLEQLDPGQAQNCHSCTITTDRQCAREAIVIPAPVSYAAACGSGAAYDGAMDVLTNILNFDYLWNEIRVKGGAYGCGFRAGSTGSLGFSSYRDPSPVNSLDVFRNAQDFVRSFCAAGTALDGYIIGAAASQEPLMGDREKLQRIVGDYIMGITRQDRNLWRQQLLDTTCQSLCAKAQLLERAEYAVCIVGAKDVFDDSWTVLEL